MTAYSDAILALSPRGYWRLDSSALTTDSSGNGKTLTQNGTNFVSQPSLVGDPDDEAAAFDDATASGTLDSADASFKFNPSGSFSVVVWFRPTVLDATFRRIVSYSDDASGATFNGFQIYAHSTAGIGFGRFTNNVGVGGSMVPPQWNVATPHMAAMTYNGSTVWQYIDDGSQNRSDPDTGTQGTYLGSFRIGSGQFSANAAIAVIDEVAIFGSALAQTDVQKLYNIGRPFRQAISPVAMKASL